MTVDGVSAPGDDYGPGSYTYPTDPVFVPGSYDIESFSVAHNEQTWCSRLP